MKSGYLGDLRLPVDLRFIAKSTGVHHTATMMGRSKGYVIGPVHGEVQGHSNVKVHFPPTTAIEKRPDGYWHVSYVERRQPARRHALAGWVPGLR